MIKRKRCGRDNSRDNYAKHKAVMRNFLLGMIMLGLAASLTWYFLDKDTGGNQWVPAQASRDGSGGLDEAHVMLPEMQGGMLDDGPPESDDSGIEHDPPEAGDDGRLVEPPEGWDEYHRIMGKDASP